VFAAAVVILCMDMTAMAQTPNDKKQDFEETFLFLLYGDKGEARKDRILFSDAEKCIIKIKEPTPGFGDAEFTFHMNNAYVNGIQRDFKGGRWVIVVPSEPELVEVDKAGQMYFLYVGALPDYKNWVFIDSSARGDKAVRHLYDSICAGKKSKF
jgi:hypothetical protein